MNYKNIILIPEGIFFKEKTAQKNALNKIAKLHNDAFNRELFTTLFERYENSSRSMQINLILTALFPDEDKSTILTSFFEALGFEHRLLKNVDQTVEKLNNQANLFITSIYPQAVISKRLRQAKIDLPLIGAKSNNFTPISNLIEEIINKNNLDKNETLIIGSNLSDEIQAANDLNIPSLWVSTNRKVPITPHPNLHVKKFEDVLFYFMNSI